MFVKVSCPVPFFTARLPPSPMLCLQIRLVEGRDRPIDRLAKNVLLFGEQDAGEEDVSCFDLFKGCYGSTAVLGAAVSCHSFSAAFSFALPTQFCCGATSRCVCAC